MHANVLIYYSLGSVSVLLTCAVAILNGICYATSKFLPTDSPAIELAIVGLHAMNCVELVVLALLLGKDVKYDLAEWTAMKTWICCCIGVFLFITTAATAAATAWRNPQSTMGRSQALIISQCVMWAASVFHQGLFCGFILVSAAKRDNDRKWRYLFQQDMESRYGSSAKGKGRPVLPSLHYDRPLQSVPSSPRSVPGRLSPVRSFAANVGTQVLDRYSARTLLQQEFRGSSLDLASPEFPLVRGNPHVRQGSHDTCSGFSENHARKGHKSHSEVKSLDSVILQPSSPKSSLPTAPSPNTDPAKQVSAKQCTPSENHIHPLFRSGSASPPPTPAPGTVVTASPVAGQTISARMVGRMKSSPSIQASGERSRSPLTESVASLEDAQEPESPSYKFVLPILGADSQRSVSRQGRGYDLNESPFES